MPSQSKLFANFPLKKHYHLNIPIFKLINRNRVHIKTYALIMPVKQNTHPFYERLSLVLVGLTIFGYLVILGKEVLDPLVFGFIFAILLLPIANFLEKRLRLPRALSSLGSILLLIGFVGGILYLVGSQISNLANDWPMLKGQVTQSLNDLSDWIQGAFHINANKQMSYVHDTTKKNHGVGLHGSWRNIRCNIVARVVLCVYPHFYLFYIIVQAHINAFYHMGFQR